MVALATVLWSISFDPLTAGATAPLSRRLLFAVDPLVPAGATGACIRLLFTSGGRLASATLLAGAGIAAFVASLGWTLLSQADAYVPGGWVDLLWIASVIAGGASALHPTMSQVTEPARRAQDAVTGGRMTVLALALLATPAALLHAAGSVEVHIALPVGGSAVLAVFVLIRLARLVRDRERARRELAESEAHQAAVSRLAAEALTHRDVEDLYRDAERLVGAVLDGADVAVRPGTDGGQRRDDREPVGRLRLPVTGLDGPVAVLEATDVRARRFTGEEQDFLSAVANVLASAVQRRQAEEELRHRALHDPLTELPNRALLLDRLDRALSRRDGAGVGVLFVDLDGFKAVNDAHGHDAGDRLLVSLAERMCASVRAGDTVARLAGDEFVVVVDPWDDRELSAVAERVLGRITRPVDVGGTEVTIGASIDAVRAQPDEREPELLLRRADASMYDAKERGGGLVVAAAAPDAGLPCGRRRPVA